MRQSAPPYIDTLLAFCILLLTIWIFQVLLESLKIHRGRPRSNLSDVENSPKWPWFVKIIEKFFPGRSCKHPMVGRPQTLWSVDQATFEWNGPKTESSVNDFLHKRVKMCNSDFLDCKLKSQKFNYRFDSMSWFYMTLWYQKILEQVNVLLYAAPCCFSGHGPVPLSSKMNEYYTMSQNNIAMNPPSIV